MKNEEYVKLIRSRMGDKRFNHSLEVSKSAVYLAKKYGADADKAAVAGILHDVCKETPASEQLKIIDNNGIILSNVEKEAFKLWHAISGSAFVKSELKIDDADIINAIRYHTTARAGMSLLEKVVYIADYISADRTYNGVVDMRSAAERGLEEAMRVSLEFSIGELLEDEKCIHPDTVMAYNEVILSIA